MQIEFGSGARPVEQMQMGIGESGCDGGSAGVDDASLRAAQSVHVGRATGREDLAPSHRERIRIRHDPAARP